MREAFEDYFKNVEYPRSHEDYGRQYMGATTPSGDIIIYVNCFAAPDDYEQKWLFRVDVSDGGDSFFEGMINLTKEEIMMSFPVNYPEVYALIREETDWMIAYAKKIGYR